MENFILVITAAVVIDGGIVTPGQLVEVTKSEARDLLNRGKARIATEHDGTPPAPEGTANAPGGHQGSEQAAANTSAPAAPGKAPKTAKTPKAAKPSAGK